MKYRHEIDGLRAIALIAILFFHSGLNIFNNGYIGVDIFFVVSGFLITSILIIDFKKDRFSLVHFYERRMRRIFPALFVVLFVSSVFSLFFLMPNDLKVFSQTLFYVSFFISNIFFSKEVDYFNTHNVGTDPLLHTWTIALEEQFYILYPIVFLLLWGFGKKPLLVIFTILACSSFLLGEINWTENRNIYYYSALTRAWQLLTGALGAFLVQYRNVPKSNSLSILGFVGLVLSFLLIEPPGEKETEYFSSIQMSLPTFSTLTIILFGQKGSYVSKILSVKVMRWLGLSSYSIYLWHRPLFVFSEKYFENNMSTFHWIAVILLTLAISHLSWKIVESPFRSRTFLTRRQIFTFGLIGTLFFASLGTLGYTLNGLPMRFGNDKKVFLDHFDNTEPTYHYYENNDLFIQYRIYCGLFNNNDFYKDENSLLPLESIYPTCYKPTSKTSKVVLIWGDSHAYHLYPGLYKSLDPNWEILQMATPSCAPQPDANFNIDDRCETSNYFATNIVQVQKPDVVVLAQNEKRNSEKLNSISSRLIKMGAKKVVIVGPTPHWKSKLYEIVVNQHWGNIPEYSRVQLNEEYFQIDARLKKELVLNDKIVYVSLLDSLCNSEGCLVKTGNDLPKDLLVWDWSHFTLKGSEYVSQKALLPVILPGN